MFASSVRIVHGFDFLALRGGASMALIFSLQRGGVVDGCRWLMYDEMLGAFILLLGSPG